MIFFKEATIYAGYATLKAAENAAAKIEFRTGDKVVIELCGSVYLVVGAMTKEQAIRNAAQVELDRLAELYKRAGERYNDSIGQMGEKRMFKDAIGIFNRMESTKQAYATLGITGCVGAHYISVKAGA